MGARHARWGERRLRELEESIGLFPQIDSSPAVSHVWGKLIAERKHAGNQMNPNDAWIAACCIAGELPLATFNRKDFEGIEGLELFLD
ncbi:MAG: PIN domain-containing protein [Acidimicrobiia bacterium]